MTERETRDICVGCTKIFVDGDDDAYSDIGRQTEILDSEDSWYLCDSCFEAEETLISEGDNDQPELLITYKKNVTEYMNDNNHNDSKLLTKTSKGKSNMTMKVQKIKKNAEDAAWRTAATNAVKLARKPLIAALSTQFPKNPQIKLAAAFLNTPEGEALLSFLIGVAPLLLPQMNTTSDPRVERLAEEMRTRGIQIVAEKLLDPVVEPLTDALNKAVSKLPKLGSPSED